MFPIGKKSNLDDFEYNEKIEIECKIHALMVPIGKKLTPENNKFN